MVAGNRTAQDRERPRRSSSLFSAVDFTRLGRVLVLTLTLGVAPSLAGAVVWPWEVGDPWPTSSERAVEPLAHPPLEMFLIGRDLSVGFEFVAYGDQRALADGEWQQLVADVARRVASSQSPGSPSPGPPPFVIDTGDIVNDGRYSDQFGFLSELLRPIASLPYLVAVGNHEVCNDEEPRARDHLAMLLAPLDPAISRERFYYKKEVGPLTFLFLDSNEWVYGPSGRGAAQRVWLEKELSRPLGTTERRIVVMHHPFVQSSRKHEEQASALWSADWSGRTLAARFVEGGVSLVLCGHTHTFEHFRLEQLDGRGFDLVNVSGRPRESVLWFGKSARRARDIAGVEMEELSRRGWRRLDGWRISQLAAMTTDESGHNHGIEANQYLHFRCGADGRLSYDVIYLDPEAGDGVRLEHGAPLR